ncbi:lysozyme [Synechococcus phage S-CREM1]|nr:lysozyme [Synechococcus phage S-CREM1]
MTQVPQSGLELIKTFEGCHLHAYPDPLTKGPPITIGWGSTRDFDGQPFKIGRKITQKYADDLLLFQLKNQFLPVLQKIPYWNEMNENQKGALLSFAYNLGANFYGSQGFATITRVLKTKNWSEVPKSLYLYRNPGSNVEAGLARRRTAEGNLWKLTGEEETPMAMIDLHNFFKHYDENNPKHVEAVEQFEKVLLEKAPEEVQDSSTWVKTYRTKAQKKATNILEVPFYPQTDNYRDADRTCNSSACAMCLEYFKPGTLKGPKGDDAYVQKVFATGDTTDHLVQTRVLASYGIKSHFSYSLSFADLDREIAAGRPVVIGILHRGPITAPRGGHMVVVIGKTPAGDYIVNDPYGSLNDGYTGAVSNGKGAVYKRSELARRWTPDGPTSGWGRVFT